MYCGERATMVSTKMEHYFFCTWIADFFSYLFFVSFRVHAFFIWNIRSYPFFMLHACYFYVAPPFYCFYTLARLIHYISYNDDLRKQIFASNIHGEAFFSLIQLETLLQTLKLQSLQQLHSPTKNKMKSQQKQQQEATRSSTNNHTLQFIHTPRTLILNCWQMLTKTKKELFFSLSFKPIRLLSTLHIRSKPTLGLVYSIFRYALHCLFAYQHIYIFIVVYFFFTFPFCCAKYSCVCHMRMFFFLIFISKIYFSHIFYFSE